MFIPLQYLNFMLLPLLPYITHSDDAQGQMSQTQLSVATQKVSLQLRHLGLKQRFYMKTTDLQIYFTAKMLEITRDCVQTLECITFILVTNFSSIPTKRHASSRICYFHITHSQHKQSNSRNATPTSKRTEKGQNAYRHCKLFSSLLLYS